MSPLFLLFFCWTFQVASQKDLYKLTNETITAKSFNNTENDKQNFCILEIFKTPRSDQCNKKIDIFKIYICTILVMIGASTNLLSFFVFLRADKRSPRILSKKILMLLTISNSIYLILYWYLFGLLYFIWLFI